MDKYRQYVCAQLQGINEKPDLVLDKLAWYISELLKWNQSVNLTSITDPNECWEKHIQDSLLVLPYIFQAEKMLDIGSGAGLPAIPVKISCPEMYIVSVDKVRKKVNFQNHCKRHLSLHRFEAINANILNLKSYENSFDVVVARAVASLEMLVKMGAAYIKPGGRLLALKGRIDQDELEAGSQAGKSNALELEQVIHTTLKPSMAERTLVIMRHI
ncbi:MAG: 16S rRNA (guanine(527)-N(7))-methyltransferase RsmG [Geobacteraceae bacterium]|nr:16S rRNA (guanine(527)-N(7))-methyltransferase RsmG [Geobacteraceae bacterium]